MEIPLHLIIAKIAYSLGYNNCAWYGDTNELRPEDPSMIIKWAKQFRRKLKRKPCDDMEKFNSRIVKFITKKIEIEYDIIS